MQQVVVIGAGAIGTVLAGWLTENPNNDVTIVGHEDQVNAINTIGVSVQSAPQLGGATHTYERLTGVRQLRKLEPGAIIFIATKATQLEDTLKEIAHLVRNDTTIVTLQNGMGITEIANDTLEHKCTIVRGILYIASVYLNPAVAQHNGGNKIQYAAGSHDNQLSALAKGTPLVLQSVETIEHMVFLKASLNCVINPLSALYRIRVGRLLGTDHQDEVRGIVREVEALAAAEGIALSRSIGDTLESAMHMIANSYSSMYQDLAYGRETEIEFINGAMLRIAESHGIAMPHNKSAYDRIKAIESGVDAPDLVT